MECDDAIWQCDRTETRQSTSSHATFLSYHQSRDNRQISQSVIMSFKIKDQTVVYKRYLTVHSRTTIAPDGKAIDWDIVGHDVGSPAYAVVFPFFTKSVTNLSLISGVIHSALMTSDAENDDFDTRVCARCKCAYVQSSLRPV